MNRAYLGFRNLVQMLSQPWVDAMLNEVGKDDLIQRMEGFYEHIDATVRALEEHRTRLEERRSELTVLPLSDAYPPVKPPNYFGGDLMGVGPWSQFWSNIEARAHAFRETVG